jgi:hypothetical protein
MNTSKVLSIAALGVACLVGTGPARAAHPDVQWSLRIGVPIPIPVRPIPLPRYESHPVYNPPAWRDRDRDGIPDWRDRHDNRRGAPAWRQGRDRDRDGVPDWRDPRDDRHDRHDRHDRNGRDGRDHRDRRG